jgi:predicted MFS family arabinose efflux permease
LNKEKAVLFLLAAIQFTHIVDFMIMMPLGPQLMRLFEISPAEFSWLVSSYTFSAGIMGFIGAFFLDRFDRKKVLQVVYLGFILGTFACAFAPGYYWLMAARILTGAFGGILSATSLAIVGDLIPEQRRATAMGIVMTAFSLAGVLGVPIGLYLASLWTWHAPFIWLGATAFFIFVLIQIIVPNMRIHLNSERKKESPLQILLNVTGNKNLLFALCTMTFLMLGQFTVIPFISPYMVSNVGFAEDQLPLIYFLGGLCTIFTVPLVGKLADKRGKYKVFSWAIFLSVIPLLLLTNLPQTTIYVALVVTTFFMITIGSRGIPAQAMITSTVKPAQRGSFMSFNSSVQQLSAGLASLISGFIIHKSAGGELENYGWIGLLAAFCSFISLWFASKLKNAEGKGF